MSQVSKKLQVWADVAKQVNPTQQTLKHRMKADRDGILKRLRTGMRKKMKIESGLGKPKKIVPKINVETISESIEKKPYSWVE